MASLESLEELLEAELKDIYDAEKQLTRALPKMVKKASAPELRDAFQEHLRQTEQHVERLEQAFEQLGMPARGKKCEGMKHLIAEGEEMMRETKDDDTRDALMIAAAQKVEHYEIATYGTIRTWAGLLGKNDVASLFEETLEEEKEADQKLTTIAESSINERAINAGEDEEDEERSTAGRSQRVQRARGSSDRAPRTVAADKGRAAAKRPRGR
jgi:ferritin-like metal-binding protein YciE